MTNLNFQDVIRHVYDEDQNLLRTTAGAGNSTVFVGTPTLYAVVNTSAAGDSVLNIGFATVSVSNPTLYAVVNTSAPGVGNSIVTVANTPLDTRILGNVTLSDPKAFIGLTTTTLGASPAFIGIVTVANSQANTGNVTLNASPNQIGSVTVSHPVSVAGNLTLSDSKTYIGLTTSTLGSGVGNIGFATVNVAGFGPAVSVSPAAAGDFGWWQEDDGHTSGQKGVFALAVRNSLPTLMTSAELDYSSFSVDEYGRTLVAGNPTVFIGTPTLYAVVNTGAVGVTNSIVTVANTPLSVNVIGNVTVSDAKTYIGLTTTTLGVGTQFIGLVTVAPHSLVGNLTLSDAKTYIGLNTSTLGSGDRFIGLVTAWVSGLAGNVTLSDAKTYVGLVTATLGASPAFVGIVTVTNRDVTVTGNITLSDSKTYVGLTTSTLGVGTQFIGLVTANAINAGTNKTLISLPVGLGNNSLATVAVPTNANKIKVTNIVLGSNVTTEIAIKSGVTYLTGNASLGITLFPGGGFELPGSPDSPSWIGLPSGAIVIEKRDSGGTVSKIGGGLIYFDEA